MPLRAESGRCGYRRPPCPRRKRQREQDCARWKSGDPDLEVLLAFPSCPWFPFSDQRASFPPSVASDAPVMKEALSEARKRIAAATSSGWPMRHAQECSENIRVKSRGVAFGGLVGEGSRLTLSTSVVDGCVEAAEARYSTLDEVSDVAFVTHIGLHELCICS